MSSIKGRIKGKNADGTPSSMTGLNIRSKTAGKNADGSPSSMTGLNIRGRTAGKLSGGNDNRPTHEARPLASLTDPDSFAPPPTRRGTGLAAAPPPIKEKRQVVLAPSKYQDPRAAKVEPPPKISSARQIEAPPQEYDNAAPRPYRTDTTGLRTDHLPPPPGRRDGADGRSPPPYEAQQNALPAPSRPKALPAPKPSLPPRLPPRTASTDDPAQLNHASVARLGSKGVSVPGLGIGGDAHVNELQNRFAGLKTTQSQTQEAPAPAQGTTWAQKQAAVKTASQFQKDPSSVSFADAKAAAGTANNFRQRHGEQIAAGAQQANSINNKYGVANKMGGFASKVQGQDNAVAAKKKPPPPPPPAKKPQLFQTAGEEGAPPPVPMSTRPNF